jgi:hypothetical protein|mmetsp:Transcript_66467/g.111114  ORF Transcript_66467/g.111114 Transcript_66467/m.111114 type:complete len:344 (+) Transcript_66467:24-1055(+)|eukprot:CAMPEP_0174304944 /NCGR_PEP_ID=MMETSP0809-20121228/61110_1 /TAXON_ID=73025 ORGANISM="Eutreptiella gymnastica-like, Strain CCMP1594" /NCGR_SAMPLE_ID=MMETSP0809 /ASSEMBLY_ACC=CAM_ASM_000658 /LENGTH=343 /DNA_ID=CAMNT_0015411313 /DNA_START=20 /DNA_END=1051 /DNA_ORIENTATION=-
MGKVATFFKVSLGVTLLPTAAFIGYRKREISEIQRSKREEIQRLDNEFDRLAPDYKKKIAAHVKALKDSQEQERLKTTLWEDRLRRFKEETDEFMQYAAVVPKQLQELEELNTMYWMACKVLTESKRQEEKYEAECRKIHQGLLAGAAVLLTPDSITSKSAFLDALGKVRVEVQDPLLDTLEAAALQLDDNTYDTHGTMEERFLEGLRMIERTQFSISGPGQSNLPARVFSKAQQNLQFAAESPVSKVTAEAPKRFVTDVEVQQGLKFAETFISDAKSHKFTVAITGVPVANTPEGRDAVSYMEGWVKGAQSYLSLRNQVRALNTYLNAQSMRLGFPEVAAHA